MQLLKAEEIASMLGLKVQTVYTVARWAELEKAIKAMCSVPCG
jgi:hypothetical protein